MLTGTHHGKPTAKGAWSWEAKHNLPMQHLRIEYRKSREGVECETTIEADWYHDLYDRGQSQIHLMCPRCMNPEDPHNIQVEADCGGGCTCEECAPDGATPLIQCGCKCHHGGGHRPGCACRFDTSRRGLTIHQSAKPFTVDRDGRLTVSEPFTCTYCYAWTVRITNGVAHDAL